VSDIRFWRDKAGREIDFVIARSRDEIDLIECKWSPDHLDPGAMKVFRGYYPRGNNYLICPITVPGYLKEVSGVEVYVCNPEGLAQHRYTRLTKSISPFPDKEG